MIFFSIVMLVYQRVPPNKSTTPINPWIHLGIPETMRLDVGSLPKFGGSMCPKYTPGSTWPVLFGTDLRGEFEMSKVD
jgi:hypothetical protein